MRKWNLLRIVPIIVVFAIAITMQACAPKSQEDCGFVQNVYGERISWKGQIPVVLKIHSSVPNNLISDIQAAAETWNQAIGRKVLVVDTVNRVTGDALPRRDNVNVIYFMDSWESDRQTEQARTSVYWVGDQIKEADIRINANFSFYSNSNSVSSNGQVNMQALVLHEMGHVLGLKHKDGVGSVMETYLAANTARVKIAATDTGALRCEY